MPVPADALLAIAPDLTRGFPRSPRALLGGYAVLPRIVDKCRAVLAGRNGEYHFNSFMDSHFFAFTGIDPQAFKAFIATGAPDEDVLAWVQAHSRVQDPARIAQWSAQVSHARLTDLPPPVQAFLSGYIERHLPPGRTITRVFDIFDIEEGRM